MSNKIQGPFPNFQTESRLEPIMFIAIAAGRGKEKERPLSSLGAQCLVNSKVFFCDVAYMEFQDVLFLCFSVKTLQCYQPVSVTVVNVSLKLQI